MFKFLIACLLVGVVGVGAFGQAVSVSEPRQAELVEGKTYSIEWLAGGGETVKIKINGTRTPLGKASRGDFSIVVAENVSAAQGTYSFVLPWIDANEFKIRVEEYDGSGHLIASGDHGYSFRPEILADRLLDGIYLDLHLHVNQRLYVQKDGKITKIYISSSSKKYHWLPPNRHIPEPHDHAGVFKVLSKETDHWSDEYEVDMYWAMRYLSGHYIHATSANLYRYLGRPSSHGCNRLTRYDAQEIYKATPVGTRVEIIGPPSAYKTVAPRAKPKQAQDMHPKV